MCLHRFNQLNCSYFAKTNKEMFLLLSTIIHQHFFPDTHYVLLYVIVNISGALATSTTWISRAKRPDPARRRKRVRQAPTRAPAPYMHPIHSYLVPVTRWLQNGIDYWFPSYHRSVVTAGFGGLTERPGVGQQEEREQHKAEIHKRSRTDTYS